MNENALKFFNNMAHQTDLNQNSVKLAHNTDFTDIDANFILKFANKSSNLLDLGSGTGLIVNKIFEHVKSIECLEPFRQFSDYIVKAPNVTIQNKSVFEYKTNRKFDLVTMFGFMHYFNEEEAIFIYKRIKNEFLMGGG